MNVDEWAQELIQTAVAEHGGPLARYGTPAWARMPPKQRWASVLIAAQCWRTTSAPEYIAARLRDEIEQARLLAKQAEDADYQSRAAMHRKQWRHLSLVKPPRYAKQPVRPLEDIGADYIVERRRAEH